MPRLRALAALAALVAGGWMWALAGPEGVGGPTGPAGTTPAERKVSVRVGGQADFAVAPETGATARWRLDGAAVGTGPTWTFVPAVADVGRHVVQVDVPAGGTSSSQRWDVRVTPPRLPRVAGAAPGEATVRVEVDREVVLRFDARPATPGETVRVMWTVDGVPAGEGATLRWKGSEPANVRARALAVGSFGAAVGREWSILVRVPTTTTTTTIAPTREAERVEPIGPLPPSAPERAHGEVAAERPVPADATRAGAETHPEQEARQPTTVEAEPLRETPTTTEPPREVARGEAPVTTLPPPAPPTTLPPLPTSTTLPPPPPPPPPTVPTTTLATLPPAALASRGADRPASSGDDEVRRLLDRYAAAWRNHDVAELRRIGQVTSDSQATDLERYFAKVEDLDVEVNVIEVRNDGDRATVRFTRRDRFRDPTGRLVTQESPPIEKRVVRSPDGLRFEPGSR
jgi:hypothetical protein